MATAEETLRMTLSKSEFGILGVLSESTPLSVRKVATALGVPPTTIYKTLARLPEAGFNTSRKPGWATLWQLAVCLEPS